MTNTDLAIVQQGAAATALPEPVYSPTPLDRLMQHVEAMEAAHKLASAMCATDMVPERYRNKPDDGAAAILYGMELDLSPIQSLQRLINIKGTPGMEARTMVGLLKAKGYRFKTVESTDTSVTVYGKAPNGDDETSTWTYQRAEQAGYTPQLDEKTGKYKTNAKGNLLGNEKYLTDPQAMLYAKAAAEVCRKLAPEVLLGLDVLDGDRDAERADPIHVASERVAPGVAAVKNRLGIDKATTAEKPSDSSVQAEASDEGAKPERGQVGTDDVAPGKPTAAQSRKIKALLKDVADDDRLTLVRNIIGRHIAGFGDLDQADAAVLVGALEEMGPEVVGQVAEQLRAEKAAVVEQAAE